MKNENCEQVFNSYNFYFLADGSHADLVAFGSAVLFLCEKMFTVKFIDYGIGISDAPAPYINMQQVLVDVQLDELSATHEEMKEAAEYLNEAMQTIADTLSNKQNINANYAGLTCAVSDRTEDIPNVVVVYH